MISKYNDLFLELKKTISKEKKLVKEIIKLNDNIKSGNEGDKSLIKSQINSLKKLLRNENKQILKIVEKLNVIQPLKNQRDLQIKETPSKTKKTLFTKKIFKFLNSTNKKAFSGLEKETVKRIWKKEKKVVKEEDKKISRYIQIANSTFGDYSGILASNYHPHPLC